LNLKQGLKEVAESLGLQSLGIARPQRPPHLDTYVRWIEKGNLGQMSYLEEHLPLKEHPAKLLPEVRSVIAVTLNYYQPLSTHPSQPRISRYALGRDYHRVMRSKLRALAAWLEERVPGSIHRPCVDSAPIMERDFAQLAGLGWFGNNTMLIDSRRGSWFFIGILLSSIEIEPDEPAVGGCGTCRACIESCPTGAIVFDDGRWQVEARRCISYQTIEHVGDLEVDTAGWTFGCDICQEVCPFNQPRESQPLRAQVTTEPDFLTRRQWPDLVQLAQVEQAQWDMATQGSPVRRAGWTGLKRNAAANLAREEQLGPDS
jgi:epoxyqueuosine reductase